MSPRVGQGLPPCGLSFCAASLRFNKKTQAPEPARCNASDYHSVWSLWTRPGSRPISPARVYESRVSPTRPMASARFPRCPARERFTAPCLLDGPIIMRMPPRLKHANSGRADSASGASRSCHVEWWHHLLCNGILEWVAFAECFELCLGRRQKIRVTEKIDSNACHCFRGVC